MEERGRRHGVVSGGFDGSGGATADDDPSALRVPCSDVQPCLVPSAPSPSIPFII